MIVIHYLRNYLRIIGMKFSTRMAYRGDFIISLLATLAFQLTGPAFIAILYASGAEFPGWSFPAMLLLQGLLNLIKGFAFMLFIGIFFNSIRHSSNGTLVTVLLRPIHSLWMLFMEAFDEEDIGQVMGGFFVIAFALSLLEPLQGSVIAAVGLLMLGLLFLLGITLLFSAAAIYFVQVHSLMEILMGIIIFAQYPKTIYRGLANLVVTSIIPLSIAAFYPASVLLGYSLEGLGTAIASTVLFVLFCYSIWRMALRYYTSAGG